MVFIKIEGADQVIAMEFSGAVQKKLAGVLGIDEGAIAFLCPESFFVHGGQEQTSFRVLVEVMMPKELQAKEAPAAALLAKKLHDIAVHSHVVFTYFDKAHEYDEIDHDYPDYMDSTNMVKAAAEDEPEDEDGEQSPAPYMGNVFSELDGFVASHPEMSKDRATIEYYKQKNGTK